MEPWNAGGTLVEPYFRAALDLSGLRPQSFQLLGKKQDLQKFLLNCLKYIPRGAKPGCRGLQHRWLRPWRQSSGQVHGSDLKPTSAAVRKVQPKDLHQNTSIATGTQIGKRPEFPNRSARHLELRNKTVRAYTHLETQKLCLDSYAAQSWLTEVVFCSSFFLTRDLPLRFFVVLTHCGVMGLDELGELGEMDGLNSFERPTSLAAFLLGASEPKPQGRGLGRIPRHRCGSQHLVGPCMVLGTLSHGCGSIFKHPGTADFVYVSIYQGNPFWAPIFDPPPQHSLAVLI